MTRLIFSIVVLAELSFGAVSGLFEIMLFDTLQTNSSIDIAILLGIHIGLITFFPLRHYAIGLAIMALMAVANVYVGGVIGRLIEDPGFLFKDSSEAEYNELLLRKLVNTLSTIPFFVVTVFSIPYKRIEQWVLERRIPRFPKTALVIINRSVENVLFVVLPEILDVSREERPVAYIRGQYGLFSREGLSAVSVYLIGVVAEFIIASSEPLPHWIDELSAGLEKHNGE